MSTLTVYLLFVLVALLVTGVGGALYFKKLFAEADLPKDLLLEHIREFPYKRR
ncbi:MAG: hypothetical protein OQK12_17790 [Motiliproteus sp.]|nr:hypothetical protein [Motiliproteus sp.]MCW9053530.1 hypothetical protein [Motiliproteus sp.]